MQAAFDVTPYCMLHFLGAGSSDAAAKYVTAQKKGTHPVWNETKVFEVVNVSHRMFITVMNYRKGRDDLELGTVEIDLRALHLGSKTEVLAPLQGHRAEGAKIRLALSLHFRFGEQ